VSEFSFTPERRDQYADADRRAAALNPRPANTMPELDDPYTD
jgi:hypothetical protein